MCEDWMVECPLCSVVLNIATWLSLIAIFWCAVDHTTYNGVVSPRDLVAVPFVLFVLLYCFYLNECYFATTRKHLSNVIKGQNIFEFIERVQHQPPTVTFKAVCWHNETKQQMVRFTDRRGKTRMRTENYQEKVVSFEDEENFCFNEWEDISKLPEGMQCYGLARVSFTKAFKLKTPHTATLFTNLSCGFQARNRHRDKRMDYDERLGIEGFSDHVIAYVDEERKEKWISLFGYWMFSVLLMSWLFRWKLKRRFIQEEMTILKQMEVTM